MGQAPFAPTLIACPALIDKVQESMSQKILGKNQENQKTEKHSTVGEFDVMGTRARQEGVCLFSDRLSITGPGAYARDRTALNPHSSVLDD